MKKDSRIYKLYRRHRFGLAVLSAVGLFVLACFALVVANGQTVQPEDMHIVNIYVDGEAQVVPTRAATVGDILNKLSIKHNEFDLVEPSLKAPIDSDNFSITVNHALPISIEDNGKLTILMSPYKDPREAVEKAGIKLYSADKVSIKYQTGLYGNQSLERQLVIDRANTINVSIYGQLVERHTRAKTVNELLAEMGITPEATDTVLPSLNTKLDGNQLVQINSQGNKVITEEIEIPFETESQIDPTITLGSSKILQAGVKGKKLVSYEVTTVNGVESSRRVLNEVTVSEPVKQIVAIGKKILVEADRLAIVLAAGIPESDYPYVDYIVSRESGWCPTKWQGQYGQCPGYYMDIHDPSSGYGYGLCQSTPGIKMASAGSDWQTNPVTQLRWCSAYANSGKFNAYGGGWYGAYNYWLSHNNW